jgi:hypothetical protein
LSPWRALKKSCANALVGQNGGENLRRRVAARHRTRWPEAPPARIGLLDLRVLRLERAADAPFGGLCRKFFWLGESAPLGPHHARESARERRAAHARAAKRRARRRNKSPHFTGTSAMRANFLCARARRKNFSTCDFAHSAPRSRRGGGSRGLHTKLSEVTVIFFLL